MDTWVIRIDNLIVNGEASMRNYLIILLLAIPTHALANDAQERALLDAIQKEIVFLESKLSEAQGLRGKNQRYYFDYKMLKNDLSKIRGGIINYLDRPLREPRQSETIKPVIGNY